MLRFLTTKVDRWRQVHFPAMSKQPHSKTLGTSDHRSKTNNRAFEFFKPLRQPLKPPQISQSTASASSLIRRSSGCKDQPNHSQAAFALAILMLTAAIGQRFYNQPELQVDTEAPQTILAPASAIDVIDFQTTDERRIAARNGALRVLMFDSEANRKITQTLENFIKQGNDLRREAGVIPFIETSLLSTNTQRYIRQADENSWQKIWLLARTPIRENILSQSGLQSRTHDLLSIQQRALDELLSYRQRVSAQEFAALSVVIEETRAKYRRAISDVNDWFERDPGSPYSAALFDLSEAEWKKTQSGLRKVTKRMIAQGIPQGFPADLKEQAIRVQLSGIVPANAESLSIRVLMLALQSNLIEDKERTRLQAEQAAEPVEQVTVSVSQGEIIVRAGEKITQANFVLLDHFNLSGRRFNWLGLGGFGVLMGGAVSVFLLVEHFYHPGLRRRDHILITLLALTPAGLIALNFPALSLPAVGLLVGSFYGAALGAAVVGLLAIVLPIGASVSPIPLAASAAGALVGSLIASRLRSREELALLGGFVGLTQGAVHLILTLMLSPVSTAVWIGVLSTSALEGLYGVAWSVVALGLSPYLEHLFDLVTPIRLAELSNPNRPLLKRLASEAPGTFQHTLFVASLAEAAARALGCNVELVRAGTLYHDIGKMHDPLGFIENQMGGPNKHDQIAHPWKSAEIIKKHVDEGLVMARKHRLPKALQAFIPEHQGTMLIGYFYHQAQQQTKDDPSLTVQESDFRYDGPIPQTPETGIVMLADSCEAALRSLKDATPEEAFAMVNKILRARWKDHQLADSCLTRENMSTIAQIFVQVWQQYNHKRIVYPKVLPVKPIR